MKNNKDKRKMRFSELLRRMSLGRKILLVAWPIILILLLSFNLRILVDLGTYKIDAISSSMTQRMKIDFSDYLLPVETLINGLVTNIEARLSEGATIDDIEDYLVEQTDCMTGDFAKDSTG